MKGNNIYSLSIVDVSWLIALTIILRPIDWRRPILALCTRVLIPWLRKRRCPTSSRKAKTEPNCQPPTNAKNAKYSPWLHLGLKLAYPTHPDLVRFEWNQGYETEFEPLARLGSEHGSLVHSG